MRIVLRSTFGLAALALGTGCAGSFAPRVAGGAGATAVSSIFSGNVAKIHSAGERRPDWMRPGPRFRGGTTYVSEYFGSYALAYIENNKGNSGAFCRIAIAPYSVDGIGADFANRLWIPTATGPGAGQTTVYAKQCGAAGSTIDDTDGQPANVAFGSKGTVYIENITGPGGEGAPANVDVYPSHARKPSTVLQEANALFAIGVAVDAKGDVFMSWVDGSEAGHVDEFAGGQNPAVTLPISAGFIGDVTFDLAQNMLVIDQSASSFAVYAPPYTGSALATVALKGAAVTCKLGASGTLLSCADYENGSVDVYHYSPSNPGATTYAYSYTNGIDANLNLTGIAVAPPEKN
jgi:hypothetical protein